MDAQNRTFVYVRKTNVIRAPAQGELPELLAQRGSGNAELRYDLRGEG